MSGTRKMSSTAKTSYVELHLMRLLPLSNDWFLLWGVLLEGVKGDGNRYAAAPSHAVMGGRKKEKPGDHQWKPKE
ncbi:hypothetical protein E2C01_017377 [Portunus trituberculatus]|uniref:Uncharacterized protein n=1 Tax=Portunus trituberculatus TaxID=210409 RepID=A0A5B7DTL9_PORTR|nr:hypothetical protein [Portunus trituberculatus]